MISMNWVKDYIDLKDENLNELAVKVTKAGVNIEKVVTNHIDNLTVGLVKEVKPHPDSDHLNVCQVDLGDKVEQIVCGAPNVREGLKVIVAKPGAILPGDFEIKEGKIRGIESNGMICALFELGLEEKTEETYNKGITELGNDAIVGSDPIEYLGLDDTLYELDIHKHRNNDGYYHIGFAYEVGAILGKKVTLPESPYKEIEESIEGKLNLEVQTENCPFYTAKMVKDVTIGESPEFIKKRLLAAGMRPINNVVDISNYVMLEFGQPLHFFDKNKLGNNILVRQANDEEKIITLDGKERVLSNRDIVITDGKKPVAIAGVMGAENTDVDENTKDILIESAIFNAYSIRYTSSNLNLKSEASTRYGKGLNYEYTLMALDRACYLLEKYANGKVLSGIARYDVIDKIPKKVLFKSIDVNKLLGIDISDDDMKVQLEKLGFEYKYDNGLFDVIVPNRRLDIEPNVNDIAEEIGRLYGYNNLVSTLPKVSIKKGEYKGDVFYRKTISKRLRSLGLNEVKNYTLVSEEQSKLFDYEQKEKVVLPNPMSSDKSVVRTTLIPSLINNYLYNKSRNIKDINIYEISKTYDKNYIEDTKISILISGNYISNEWQGLKVKSDFYVLKGILENILNYLGLKNRYDYEVLNYKDFHPGMSAKILLDREEIGVIGRVHPNVNSDDIYVLELSMNKIIKPVKALKYKEANKFPSITKDVSFTVNKEISSKDIEKVIKKAGGRLLDNIYVFDLYTGDKIKEDEKSIAYSLTFLSNERTLTEDEVMVIFNNIIKEVTEKVPAVLRDN